MRLLVLLWGHVLAVGLAASYLTLVAAAPDSARDLMGLYAFAMVAVTVTNLVVEKKRHDGFRG